MQTTHGQLYFSKLCYLHKHCVPPGTRSDAFGWTEINFVATFSSCFEDGCVYSMKHTVIIVARVNNFIF